AATVVAGDNNKPAPDQRNAAAAPTTDTTPEAKAVAYIEKLGGTVIRDEKQPGRPVIGVRLNGPHVTDTALSRLEDLTTLESIDLGAASITDEGLARLKYNCRLRWLDLSDTPINGAGLIHLRGLTNLEYLNLSWSNLTDEGLLALKPHARLHVL